MKIIMRRNSDIFNSKKYQNWQRRQGDAFQIGIKDFNLKTVLEPITGIQEPGQGIVGFFVREKTGESLVHSQGFQSQFQMVLIRKNLETVTFPMAGKAAVGILHGFLCGHGTQADTQLGGFFPVCHPDGNEFFFHALTSPE